MDIKGLGSMNIWSMFKHKSIKLLLFKLQNAFGDGVFCLEYNEDSDKDYFSIALQKTGQPDVRAYVYTYGQARDLFGIHLEYPWFVENEFNDSIVVYEDLSMRQIVNTLAAHFEVAALEVAV